MARMQFKSSDEYAIKLSRLGREMEGIAKKAIYEGASIVADEIKSNLNSIPTEKFRHLRNGDKFVGVPERHKEDLINSFGITPIERDRQGNWNTKIGFDGYGSIPTKRYPQGVPNQLLARAIESGSSIRVKTPFVRPAVNRTRKKVQQKMNEVIDKEIEQLMR